MESEFRSSDPWRSSPAAGKTLAARGREIGETLLPYLAPIGWMHINQTGDYFWKRGRKATNGRFRLFRPIRTPWRETISVSCGSPLSERDRPVKAAGVPAARNPNY